MGNKSNIIKKNQVLQALKESAGIVYKACEVAGIARSTFYEWIKTDENFASEYNAIQEMQIDFVESKLLQNIKNNDTTAIIFYLKTKGRKRGYQERTEIEVNQLQLPHIEIVGDDTEDVEAEEIDV